MARASRPCAGGTPSPRETDRRGLTLLEALIASVILLWTVTAVSMAISSGRQHALEAQDQLQAALAAEALLAEILAADYEDFASYHGRDEPPGSMNVPSGDAYPASFYRIGRRVTVEEKIHYFPDLGVNIKGMEIVIEAYDETERILTTVTRFVPEPSS